MWYFKTKETHVVCRMTLIKTDNTRDNPRGYAAETTPLPAVGPDPNSTKFFRIDQLEIDRR